MHATYFPVRRMHWPRWLPREAYMYSCLVITFLRVVWTCVYHKDPPSKRTSLGEKKVYHTQSLEISSHIDQQSKTPHVSGQNLLGPFPWKFIQFVMTMTHSIIYYFVTYNQYQNVTQFLLWKVGNYKTLKAGHSRNHLNQWNWMGQLLKCLALL